MIKFLFLLVEHVYVQLINVTGSMVVVRQAEGQLGDLSSCAKCSVDRGEVG